MRDALAGSPSVAVSKLVTGCLVVAFAVAALVLSMTARAGACSGDCHTVCASGCDFTSPRACVNGVATGATCLVLSGTYHETVELDADKFTEDIRLACADPVSAPCRIDGDGIRSFGFLAYRGWQIEGFEIYDTRSHGISNVAGRGPHLIRGCHIHDVGGRGINDIAQGGIVEGNRIARAFLQGIHRTARDALVQNNLVVDVALEAGGGIQCSQPGSQVLHNPVDVRSATTADGIVAASARYNVVLGGRIGLSADTDSAENLVFAWTLAPFAGVAGDPSDIDGDPLIFHGDDYRLRVGSPAIDLAASSLATLDLDGEPRDAAPDAGAYEHDSDDVAGPERWPILERIAHLFEPAAPSLVLVPGQGPAVIYVDQDAGTLVNSVRAADGTWLEEVIASDVVLPDALTLEPFRHPLATAIDPSSGAVVVVWAERATGGGFHVRQARLDGDVCGVSDCASPRWTGCGAAPLFEGQGSASVDLAIGPGDGAAVVALVYQQSGLCAGANTVPHIVVRRESGGDWTGTTLASGDCTIEVGQGVAVSVDPIGGGIDIFYTRTTGSSQGELLHAGEDGGGWVTTQVPIGTGYFTHEGMFTRVDARHRADGVLGVAFTLHSEFGSHAFGYIERVGGVWGTPSEVVDASGPGGIRPMEGLSLRFDATGMPRMGYARNGVVRSGWRDVAGWDFTYVDPRRVTGDWTTLVLSPSDEVLLAYQDAGAENDVRFTAQADPGGVAVGTLLETCDDGDPCTASQCDPVLGCIHSEVDCDDEDACTVDRCHPDDGCVYDTLGCFDGDPCTEDTCDADSGCVFEPLTCDDGDPCTVDRCGSAGCASVPDECADGNACTDDFCLEGVGCQHVPNEIACDDEDPETVDDRCRDGVCAGVPPPLELPEVIEAIAVSEVVDLLGPVVLPVVAEAVVIEDVAVLVGPVVLPVVIEGVVVDDVAALAGALVLPVVVESVVVDDAALLAGPVVLPVVVESVVVDDAPAMFAPVVLPVLAESVVVDDAPAISAPVVLPVLVESVVVDDAPAMFAPVVLSVVRESVVVHDTAAMLAPVLLPVVRESVVIHDAPALAGPVLLPLVLDGVLVADAPVLAGPVVVDRIVETIGVSDETSLLSSVLLVPIVEAIGVGALDVSASPRASGRPSTPVMHARPIL